MAPKIISIHQAAVLTSLSETTIWRRCNEGNFAPKIKMSNNRVGFDLDDINDWVEACKRDQNWADVAAARAAKTQLQKTELSLDQQFAKVAVYLAKEVKQIIDHKFAAMEKRMDKFEHQFKSLQFNGNAMRAFRSDDTRVDLPIVNSFVDLPTVKIIDTNNSYGINNKRIQKK